MPHLSRLVEVTDLREAWPHEARDFTPWLAKAENITLLAEALGLEIDVKETESSVGEFSLDILASESGSGRRIVIENQLGDSDHDHLGKLITYASGKDASVIVWVVRHAREEHRSAIEWLNAHTDAGIGFFLCEIKLYRIGDSDPAPKFDVVEKPNDWAREMASISSTNKLQHEYWVAFRDFAAGNREFTSMFELRAPRARAHYDFAIGSSRCHLCISQHRQCDELAAELYIPDDMELFDKLLSCKEAIEQESGLSFDW